MLWVVYSQPLVSATNVFSDGMGLSSYFAQKKILLKSRKLPRCNCFVREYVSLIEKMEVENPFMPFKHSVVKRRQLRAFETFSLVHWQRPFPSLDLHPLGVNRKGTYQRILHWRLLHRNVCVPSLLLLRRNSQIFPLSNKVFLKPEFCEDCRCSSTKRSPEAHRHCCRAFWITWWRRGAAPAQENFSPNMLWKLLKIRLWMQLLYVAVVPSRRRPCRILTFAAGSQV